jgi:hypothetical protein
VHCQNIPRSVHLAILISLHSTIDIPNSFPALQVPLVHQIIRTHAPPSPERIKCPYLPTTFPQSKAMLSGTSSSELYLLIGKREFWTVRRARGTGQNDNLLHVFGGPHYARSCLIKDIVCIGRTELCELIWILISRLE